HKADGPTHLAVILDKSSKTFRNDLYDQYKANRPPAPEDLIPQFPLIRDATRAFSLPCIEEEGYEADDIIASYTKAALAQGWKVTIVSSDKDLAQLIQPGVDMLDTMKNERRADDYVMQKFGVTPDRLGDVLALMGDSVDNVPGVPGIGPKTAAKLITEYGDLDGVFAAVPTMKPSKMRDKLAENEGMARLSRELVELHSAVPLPDPLDALLLREIPQEPLRAFLTDQGFNSLLSRFRATLPGDGAAAPVSPAPVSSATPGAVGAGPVAPVAASASITLPPIDHGRYETVRDEAALDRWIAEARTGGLVAVDTETDALDAIGARLVGISLATGPGRACYIPLGHVGSDMFSDRPDQLPVALVLGKLKP
ncbi:MAG: DNA polymerase I, partial [Sphingobium sp. 32-64-5]